MNVKSCCKGTIQMDVDDDDNGWDTMPVRLVRFPVTRVLPIGWMIVHEDVFLFLYCLACLGSWLGPPKHPFRCI